MTDRQKRARLREILADSKGAIAPGITDPIFARLAADCGYSAVHLSGNAIHKSFCLRDRNLLTVAEIASRTAQIADATNVPLIVDGGPAAKQTDVIARAVGRSSGPAPQRSVSKIATSTISIPTLTTSPSSRKG
jgi:methylisocitrate lyase